VKFNAGAIMYLVRAIETLVAGLGASSGVVLRWRQMSANIKAMVTEQRGPTDAEWAAVDAAIVESARGRDKILADKSLHEPFPVTPVTKAGKV
jgi:hypothetical protein